jgi:hypothetical protein
MERQEGYYWVKFEEEFQVAKYEVHRKLDGVSNSWYLAGLEYPFYDEDFEHINEVKIKIPGELPD